MNWNKKFDKSPMTNISCFYRNCKLNGSHANKNKVTNILVCFVIKLENRWRGNKKYNRRNLSFSFKCGMEAQQETEK